MDTGCGDVWCLRLGTSGEVSEIVFWQHEGGNWRPIATSLAEAIAYEITGEVAEYEDVSKLHPIDGRSARLPGVSSPVS